MRKRLQSGSEICLVITALFSLCASSSAQWTRKQDAPQYRSDLSESIVYKSKLYTFLGFYNHERETDATSDVYDPATDTYTSLAPIPDNASVTHEKIVLIDSSVWLIGGRLGKNPGPLTSAVWIYNIATDSWQHGPELRDPATGEPLLWAAGGAALLGRTLHIFGGFIIDACDNDQSAYHLTLDVDSWLADTTKPAQWKNQLTPLPIKRNHFSTVVLGGKIYAIGGQFGHDCGGGQEKPYSHVYDPATDKWTQLTLLPNARSHAEGGSFAIDGKIYIVGGQDEDGASTDKVTIFDPAANDGAGSWKDIESLSLPGKYEGGTAKIIDNTFVYSHGGETTSASPRKKTYTTTIKRNPVHKFGFSKGCLRLNADSGTLVKGKTLLFTIDDSKSYMISSNAAWLTVTKNAEGIATPNAADIEVTANTAGLAAGDYSGTITATGTGGGDNFTEATYCVSLTVKSTNPALQTLEAETAGLNGVKVSNNHPGFSGTGFVDYIHPSGDYIEWNLTASAAGSALLGFRYSNGKDTDRPLQLSVNGVAADLNLSFPATGNWTSWSTIETNVNLLAGTNTIRLTATGYSGPNIDYLTYTNSASISALKKAIIKKETAATSAGLLKAYVSPNPASENVRLILNTKSTLPISAKITDMSGRVYKTMVLQNTGLHNFNFSVKDMPSGIYIISVMQGNTFTTTKFIVK